MPRPPRLDYPGARHHVMNRGARRAPIFFDHECCALFHRHLAELPERYNVVVHAYALMPNHFHLLLQTPNANLSRAMHFLCGRYAIELNRSHEWDGPLFRGRYKNKIVEDQDYWRHLLAYIHLNPVRGGLVPRLDEADWTSHSAYVGLDRVPDWLHIEEMLELYGTPEAYFDYLKDVQVGRRQAPKGFESVVLWKKRAPGRPEAVQPTLRSATAEETLERALVELQEVTRLSREELLTAPRGRTGNRARWVVAWWLRRRDRMSGGEVAHVLEVSRARISQMVSLAREAEDAIEPVATWMQRLREREEKT